MATKLSNLSPEEQLRQLLWREELRRLDQLEDRVGDDQALKDSVVPIIADILSEAGVKNHQRVAGALAPLIVAGMRAEIRNSRDMMVDALYPITGRLVAAAVRNAFKDLIDQLNEKLDRSLSAQRWRAWAKARLTGRSEAEILLREGAAFELIDLLLIDQRTGLLLARAVPAEAQGEVDGQLLSGLLTAIMSFVRDAMAGAREPELRTLDVGDLRLHLQASPSVILAVKTKGPPPVGFESALGELFCSFLTVWGMRLQPADDLSPSDRIGLGEDLTSRFKALTEAKERNFKRRSRKGTIVLVLAGLLLLGWLGTLTYRSWQTSRIETKAQAVIQAEPELSGYPLSASYDPGQRRLTVDGLVPDPAALQRLGDALRTALPDSAVAMDVSTLPRPRDAALVDRVEALTRAASAVEAATLAQKAAGERALAALETGMEQRLTAQGDRLQAGIAQARQAWSAELEQRAGELRSRIADVQTALDNLKERLPTAEEIRDARLASWLRSQAVRFGENTELAEPTAARRTLVDVAIRLVQAAPEHRFLVIGYADDSGDEASNRQISLARAELVAARLRELGADSERLIVAGRSNERSISSETGPNSANRRVEFELLTDR